MFYFVTYGASVMHLGIFTCNSKRRLQGRLGFTIIELLVVVAIIAVLAAIAIPQFSKYRLRGNKSVLDTDAKNIYTAAQAYLSDYPLASMDTLAKFQSGGYRLSGDTVFVNASFAISSGNVEIYSNTLNILGMDNNAVVFYNGSFEFVNSP